MYPEAVNLPFNACAVKNDFVPAPPGVSCAEKSGVWIILKGNALVVAETPAGLAFPEGSLPDWAEGKDEPLFLGTWQKKPLRALRIDRKHEIPPPFVAEPFNAAEERLDDRLLTLGGMALQIFHWETMSLICSRCGGSTEPISSTRGKRCLSCKHEHFPHIHPCIIVLVKRGADLLLTRKREWTPGRYSLVAGFLDIGESLEECVAREVKEETGIEVKNIRYVGSQNWPFPCQLMAGFVAEYAGGEVAVDQEELEDARWFSPETMPQSLPAKRSIARWIIDRYGLKG